MLQTGLNVRRLSSRPPPVDHSAPGPTIALPPPRQSFGHQHRPDALAAARHDAKLAAVPVAVAVDRLETESAPVKPVAQPPRSEGRPVGKESVGRYRPGWVTDNKKKK